MGAMRTLELFYQSAFRSLSMVMQGRRIRASLFVVTERRYFMASSSISPFSSIWRAYRWRVAIAEGSV